MANGGETSLRIAIGDYPHTPPLKRGEVASPSLQLDVVGVKQTHKAFKPMVCEQAYNAMLVDGELDAAIYGAELPKDPRLQSVIPDPETAARA